VTIAVVITLAVLLAIALVVAVARDPGPDPADVAIGYARALANGDFDAVYHLIDPEMLKGRNRLQWVAAERRRPHVAFVPDAVEVRGRSITGDVATVTLAVDADRVVPVELVRRQRVWSVTGFDGVASVPDRR
jgi:hypothetical protein